MNRRAAVALLFLAALGGCAAVSDTASVPPVHPEELRAGQHDCLECHEDVSTGALKAYATFRHSSVFVREHGGYAKQGQALCASCHGPAFCQGCHARKEELKPNTRAGDRPDLFLPHRGDYVVLHQIDGRLDPGSCFRCHGNKQDARCRACHR